MATELDPGAAYLASLKRSSSAQAPAPARSPETGTGSETQQREGGPSFPQRPPVQITEKRRSPRYRCQGSARMQEVGGGASVWAAFTDISTHGCYVEAPNPFRVGTMVNLQLECGGFRIEATGEVRVAYPGVGMGVSFNKMSEQDQTRLRELVQSISRRSMILNPRVATQSLSVPPPDSWRAVSNPAAALQAIFSFFESRHMMGREEFLRIVRTSQEPGK